MELTYTYRRRNRGALAPPPLSREGDRRRSPPPPPHTQTHFWAHIYLKIPPGSLLFRSHNSTVLTPNQSVRRCFEKFIGVGTGGGVGWTQPPPVYPVGGPAPHAGRPLGPVFQCPEIKYFAYPVCISVRTNPRASKCRKPGRPHASLITLTYLGA